MADGVLIVGVDPASTKMAIVALFADEFVVSSAPKLGKSGGQSCAKAARFTERFVQSLAYEANHKFAFVEAPVVGRGGVRSTMVQCFTSGAIQGALHELGFVTEIANVSSWKKRVVGKGNATKPEVAEYLRLRWPSLYARTGGDQDLIDACCIALYGRQIVGARLA